LSERWQAVLDHPILRLELRRIRRGRWWPGRRFFLSYLVFLGVVLGYSVMLALDDSLGWRLWYLSNYESKVCALLIVVTWLLGFALPWIAPALTAAATARERELGTLDLLRTTLLTERSIVLGKLGGCLIRLWPGILALVLLTSVHIVWVAGSLRIIGVLEEVHGFTRPEASRFRILYPRWRTEFWQVSLVGSVLLDPSYCFRDIVLSLQTKSLCFSPCCPGEYGFLCGQFLAVPYCHYVRRGSWFDGEWPWLWELLMGAAGWLRPWVDLALHAAVGLFVSTLCRSSRVAMAVSYGAVLVARMALWIGQPWFCDLWWFVDFGSVPSTGEKMVLALASLTPVLVKAIGAVVLVGGAAWWLKRAQAGGK
jgi:hypothetical protein